MNNDEILNSREIRMINILIDESAADLESVCQSILDECKYQGEINLPPRSSVSTRTFEEGSAEVNLPNLSRAEFVPDLIRDREELKNRINYLQRVKLRMLNDYDFTRGNSDFQKKVFEDL